MSKPTLRSYPHLPLLTFEQCMAVFKLAKISHRRLSELCGYSRMSVYLWRKGRNPTIVTLNDVSTLAYRALACLRVGTLPMQKRGTLEQTRAVLDSIDLNAITQEVLPKHWRESAE